MKRHRRRNRRNNSITNCAAWVFIAALIFYSSTVIEQRKLSFFVIVLAAACAAIGIAPICTAAVRKRMKRKKYLKSDIRRIDGMTGIEFEEYIKAHFEALGYRVEGTPASNDYGADLVMTKDNQRTVVQVKRYREKVSNKAVQEVVGAMGYYRADKGMVITNSEFTANAKTLAAANAVELWNRYKLIDVFQVKT